MTTSSPAPCQPVVLSFTSRGSSRRGLEMQITFLSNSKASKCRCSRISAKEMVEESISSTSNPMVKHCVKLRLSSSFRHSCATTLVVGLTPILEITRFHAINNKVGGPISPSLIDCLFLIDGEEAPIKFSEDPPRIVRVNSVVMKKLTGLKNVDSTEAVAVMRFPGTFFELDAVSGMGMIDWLTLLPCAPHRVLVLDGVQDPGNLGTLIRSAMAFNWDAVFLLPGCCDPFNEKALRAARGASYQIPLLSGNWSHLEDLKDRFQMKMLAAHPIQEYQEFKAAAALCRKLVDDLATEPVCLILGSEGQGISDRSMYHSQLVSIPMAGQFESLNVAVAGGIFLYMLQRERLF